MGIISKIRYWHQIRKARKAFEPYLDISTINKIMRGELDNLNRLKECKIEFIFVKMNEENHTGIVKTAEYVLDIVGGTCVTEVFSNLIIIYVNWPGAKKQINVDGKNIAAELISRCREKISILHGNKKCWYGTYGSAKRAHHGVIIPDTLDLGQTLRKRKNGMQRL